MRFATGLNILGLAVSTAAAGIMFRYPMAVVEVTEDGRRQIAWVGDARPELAKEAKRLRFFRKLGPILLGVGFAAQLVAAIMDS